MLVTVRAGWKLIDVAAYIKLKLMVQRGGKVCNRGGLGWYL